MTQQGKETAIYVAYDDHVAFDPARPEKDLLRAILTNALADLRKPGELSRRAKEYLLSPEDDYIFSFQSICNHLELDSKTVLFVAGLRGELDRAERHDPQTDEPRQRPHRPRRRY